MKIYMNGTICDEKEAVVSVFDHGFLYGMGLFETFRTYDGIPFLLEEHLTRLHQSCQQLSIDYQVNQSEIKKLVSELLKQNVLKDGYFRLTVTAGVEALGLPSGPYTVPSTILYIKALTPRNIDLYQKGKPLQLLKLRRSSPEGMVRLKSNHYMNNILGKRELVEGAEGCFLNEQGYITEGTVSNIFFIRDQICYTPAIGTGILPGITRDFVIRLAQEMNLTVQEGKYTWEDIVRADEVFITNSIQEVVPITSLYHTDGQVQTVEHGKAGHFTSQLITQYRSCVSNETYINKEI